MRRAGFESVKAISRRTFVWVALAAVVALIVLIVAVISPPSREDAVPARRLIRSPLGAFRSLI